jgi:hypothetical protein
MADPLRLLTYAQAEAVGVQLHDHLARLGLCLCEVRPTAGWPGLRTIARDDLVWPDTVQRLLAIAADTLADADERAGHDG